MSARPSPRLRLAVIAMGAGVAFALAVPSTAISGLPPTTPPTASLTAEPNPALVDEVVTFDGSGSTPDRFETPITTYEWDLDGDGFFETNTGGTPTVSRSYADAGTIPVGLRVTDDGDDTDDATIELEVDELDVEVELLRPFPIVRLAGQVRPSGNTKIDRLAVRAPTGSEARVRCRGGSCPMRKRVRTVEQGRVRFRGMERRLRPGVVIRVFVTKPGAVGKFTRFRLRDGKVPKRRDRCAEAGNPRPIPCPQS